MLQLASGAGRLLGYLGELTTEARGLEISPALMDYCRAHYPAVTVDEGDLYTLDRYALGSFDTIWASFNALDMHPDDERRELLRTLHAMLVPGGLLILSAHNLAYPIPSPTAVRRDSLRRLHDLTQVPARVRNHRRLAAREVDHRPDFALLNDNAHNYQLIHYHVERCAQERQLVDEGFTVTECLDLDGRLLTAGEPAPWSPELHWLATA